MIRIRRSSERGHFQHGWLETYHTFSFADYHDPRHMGFRALRVINEDFVQPGRGFDTHSHRDMEIITYVLEGELEHRDSTGAGGRIRPGDVQRMSAGTGVQHSERNPSDEHRLHLLQIWIQPARRGAPPSYEQRHFSEDARRGRLCLIASADGAGGSLRIGQDARIHAALLDEGQSVAFRPVPGSGVWLQVGRGEVRVGAADLVAGDGAAIEGEPELAIAGREAELLLFELP